MGEGEAKGKVVVGVGGWVVVGGGWWVVGGGGGGGGVCVCVEPLQLPVTNEHPRPSPQMNGSLCSSCPLGSRHHSLR